MSSEEPQEHNSFSHLATFHSRAFFPAFAPGHALLRFNIMHVDSNLHVRLWPRVAYLKHVLLRDRRRLSAVLPQNCERGNIALELDFLFRSFLFLRLRKRCLSSAARFAWPGNTGLSVAGWVRVVDRLSSERDLNRMVNCPCFFCWRTMLYSS